MHNSQRKLGWYRSIKGYHIVVVILALICAGFLMSRATPVSALTTVPTKMNFQGRLTDSTGNIKPNGSYNMRLKLYTVSTAGSTVWSEDRLVSAGQGVTVTNGLFSIQLGQYTSLPASLFASGSLYLEVELASPATATSVSPTWSEGPMSPRNQLATSAYAYNAETLDGIDSASLAQLGANNSFTGNNTFTGTIQGNSSLSLGTVSSVGSLVVNDGNGQAATIQVADTAGSYVYTLPVTTGNDTFCLQTLANCGGAGSGVTTVGAYSTTNTAAGGATIAGNTITFQDASASAPGMVSTTAQTFAGVKTFTGALTVSNTATFSGQLTVGVVDVTATLLVVDTKTDAGDPTGTNGAIYYNSNAGKFRCYQGGAWTDCIGAGGGGGGGLTRKVTLMPEFIGAILQADGTNNNGVMNADSVKGLSGAQGYKHNYYQWTASGATAQDYDIVLQTQLPSEYASGMGNLKIWGYSSNTGNATATFQLEDVDGTTCYASPVSFTPSSGVTWEEKLVGSMSGCAFAANDIVSMTIHVTASNDSVFRVGEISYNYTN